MNKSGNQTYSTDSNRAQGEKGWVLVSKWRRFAVMVSELIVLFVFSRVFFEIFGTYVFESIMEPFGSLGVGAFWGVILIFFMFSFVIYFFFVVLYFVIPEFLWGKTLIKKLFGVKVVKVNGEKAGFWRLLLRNIFWALYALDVLFYLYILSSLVTIFATKNLQSIGEIASKTMIVRVNKPATR